LASDDLLGLVSVHHPKPSNFLAEYFRDYFYLLLKTRKGLSRLGVANTAASNGRQPITVPSISISLRKTFPKLFAIASQLPTELPVFYDGKMTSQAVVAEDDATVWLWLDDELYQSYRGGTLKIKPGYDVVQAHRVSNVPKKIRFNAIYLEMSENSTNGFSQKVL
jgi:hypothetical protein